VAQAGGDVSGPSGPSRRTTAWKCTTPRAREPGTPGYRSTDRSTYEPAPSDIDEAPSSLHHRTSSKVRQDPGGARRDLSCPDCIGRASGPLVAHTGGR
jgi:hypothetical protein